jgi:hypothetical protein
VILDTLTRAVNEIQGIGASPRRAPLPLSSLSDRKRPEGEVDLDLEVKEL